ncbi:MAG: succinylglutamate desuccinylase/aspartoacylase family protein [Hyphomicrobiaceae bacterium]
MRGPFNIGGQAVAVGTRQLVDLPVSKLSNHTPVTLPVHVLHGPQPGPTVFISAAIHGDELNGVEIIRRVLKTLQPSQIAGTLLAIPVVNAYGFIGRSRYLPDRRDLNRSFPGSASGSLAARLAHIFVTEVVRRCQIGVDLHTAAVHRVNLPQIRAATIGQPKARALAEAFGAQVVIESPERPGSLRKAAREAGVDVLVYEGGEGLRFDEFAIKAGVDGIARLMLHVGMLEMADGVEPPAKDMARGPVFANASKWVRAPDGGVFRTAKRIGNSVGEGEVIGSVANPYEDSEIPVRSPKRGIIVGATTLPIVNMGDALFHIAWADEHARAKIDREPVPDLAPPPARETQAEALMDEDEII